METIWSFDNSLRVFNNKEDYIPLTTKQQEKLLEVWNEERNKYIQEELNLQGDYQKGTITKEFLANRLCEIQELVLNSTQERFRQEYLIFPIKTTINNNKI